jgi:hypothetical protein
MPRGHIKQIILQANDISWTLCGERVGQTSDLSVSFCLNAALHHVSYNDSSHNGVEPWQDKRHRYSGIGAPWRMPGSRLALGESSAYEIYMLTRSLSTSPGARCI